MGFIPGAQGAKTILTDGAQVDAISENTTGAKVSFPNDLKANAISEYTSGAKVSFPNDLKASYLEEYVATNGVHIKGATNGSAIPAGYIGEELVSVNSTGLFLVTNTNTNITSLTVTAGIWDLSAIMNAAAASAISITRWWFSVSKTSATVASSYGYWASGEITINNLEGSSTFGEYGASISPGRIILTTPTTFYLVTKAIHTNGPTDVTARGQLRALRVG